MSSAAWSLIALPCGLKMPPLASSRSPRSMPLVRGRAPTSRATLAPSKATFGSSVMSMPCSSGKAQSSSSMAVPSAAFSAGGDLQQAQLDRHVRAEQLAGGDAEEQGVADLAGRAGDGDVDGSAGHGVLRMTAGGGRPAGWGRTDDRSLGVKRSTGQAIAHPGSRTVGVAVARPTGGDGGVTRTGGRRSGRGGTADGRRPGTGEPGSRGGTGAPARTAGGQPPGGVMVLCTDRARAGDHGRHVRASRPSCRGGRPVPGARCSTTGA